LYRYHPNVAALIQAPDGHRDTRRDEQLRLKVRLLTEQLRREKEGSAALVRTCAELAAGKEAMEDQFEDERLSLQIRVERLEKGLRGSET
jgi:hypothetical protein